MRPILKMEVQEKISKCALSQFFKYGIKHITMDDIARELGMSKKTIYQFFKEKDDLVKHLCNCELKTQREELDEISHAAKDPIHELMLISNKMNVIMQHINPVFFMDLQKFHPEGFAQYQKFKNERVMHGVMQNIKRGIEMGVYRADIDPVFVAKYRMAQIDMMMFGNYFTYEKISFHKTHEILMDLFVYGICTVKGHKLINNYKKIKEEE